MAEWYARTQVEVAEFFGLHTNYLKQVAWFRSVPKTEKGYDLAALTKARFKQINEKSNWAMGGDSPEAVSLNQKKTEKLDEETWIKRNERLTQEGRLLEADKTKRKLAEMVARVRSQMNGLPRQISALVPATQKAAVIQMCERTMNSAMATIWRTEIAEDRIDEMVIDEANKIKASRRAKAKGKDPPKRRRRRKAS